LNRPNFAVIGAGNGGQSIAAHLTLLGFHVNLYDIEPEKVNALRRAGKIIVSGAVTGEAVIDLITNDIGKAIYGANVIMVVVPTVYQGSLAKAMAPHLADGQIIVLNPGATGGALEVRSTLLENSCPAKVLVAETDTLLYTCRSPKAGETIIQGIKCQVNVAALPPKDVATVVAALNTAFPLYKAVPNILYTSLSNANSMMHPTPTLLNAGRIESKESFDYYTDGLTPSIARVVEAVDKERVGICAVFGIKVDSIQEWYTRCYGVTGKNLHEEVHNVAAYKGVKGPTTLDTRYLFEDVPTGLVPLAQLGQAMGVPTPTISAVVELSNKLLGRNYWEEGRSLKRLGLQGKTSEEIRQLVL
jgi:opine dehydrogenase